MLACFLRWASLLSAAAGLIAGASMQHAKAAGEPSTPPLDARIGWVDSCLAIQNDGLQPGTPVTVMLFDTDERLVAQRVLTRRVGAKILAKTTSAAKCPALVEDRRDFSEEAGFTFYTLSRDGDVSATGAFGIGIIGVEDQGTIDLDGGGAADSFTVCRANHGLSFAAWRAEPRVGNPIWEAAYYTGDGLTEKGCVPDPDLPDALEDEDVSPFNSRIGWVDKCLAIANRTLEPGTPLTILTFDSDADRDAPQKILKRRITGKIVAKTTSSDTCPALSQKRRELNAFDYNEFYTVVLDDGSPDTVLLGVGILGIEPNKPIDLDGDGVADSFTACPYIEDIHFSAWKGAPHDAASLWDAYDYLGYDTGKLDCPFASSVSQPADPPELWPPEFKLGWLYGGCLGVYNIALESGASVTIATFNDNRAPGRNVLNKMLVGRILGKTDSGADCPDLAKDAPDWNKRGDIAYYRVALENAEGLTAGALGIGVVWPDDGPIDLDQNGMPDRFWVCSTDEGIAYIAWRGKPPAKPKEDAPQWIGSLYLSHALKGLKTCPKSLEL